MRSDLLIFLRSIVLRRPHQWEQDDVADRARAGEDHGEPVDADAFTGSWRQAIGQCPHIIFIGLMRFFVAALPFGKLLRKAPLLIDGIVELAEGVAELEATNIELKALYPVGLVGLDFGER